MKMKLVVMLVLLMLVGCAGKPSDNRAKKKVGILKWAEHPALDDSVKGAREILGNDVMIIEKSAQDDLGTASMILSQFKDEGVDVVYAVATPAAQMALEALEVPLVFSAVTDPFAANLMGHKDRVVVGVSDEPALAEQMALMHRLLPQAKKVGVLFNTSESNSLAQLEVVKALAHEEGFEVVSQGVSESSEIGMATEAMAKNVDALYIMNDNLIASNISQITRISNALNVPVFTAEEGPFLQGGLATISVSYLEMGKEAGTLIQMILVGKEIPTPVIFGKEMGSKLRVNRDIATQMGIEIPSDLEISEDE